MDFVTACKDKIQLLKDMKMTDKKINEAQAECLQALNDFLSKK